MFVFSIVYFELQPNVFSADPAKIWLADCASRQEVVCPYN